jgi:hypothetical protein
MPAIDFPNSPTNGQTYSSGGRSWTWTGSVWNAVLTEAPAGANGADGADGKYVVSETAPSSPSAGDAWFDSSVGKFFIYYDSYWVEFGTSTGPQGPTGSNGTNGTNGVDGGFNTAQTVASLSTNYTLQSSDKGKLYTNSGAVTVTVQGLAVGEQVDFIQTNAAQITFTPGSGITLNSKNNNRKTSAQYSPATVKCIATNTYILAGDLAA